MRQRLQLQAPSTTPDGMGGQVSGWTTVANLWGMVDPLTGREQLQAEQVTAVLTHQISIRYRPGVVPKMRLQRQGTGSQVFEIHAVINQEMRNRELLLLCSELQGQGG